MEKDNGHAATIRKAMQTNGTKRIDPKIHEATVSLQSAAENFLDSFRTIAKVEGKQEGSYYYTWQANIAVAFWSQFESEVNNGRILTKEEIHTIANNAAKNFLDLLLSKP